MVTRFTNRVMQRGKKNTARSIVYGALAIIASNGDDPIETFRTGDTQCDTAAAGSAPARGRPRRTRCPLRCAESAD